MVKERHSLKGYFKETIFFVIKECVLPIQSGSQKLLHKWKSVEKTHFLDLTLEEDCAKRNTPFALKRREQKKEQKRRHYWRRQELKPRRVRIVTHILKTMLRENTLLGLWHFIFFSFHSIDIEKTFHEVPPVVENGEIVEVQVLEEGEIFDPDVFFGRTRTAVETRPF